MVLATNPSHSECSFDHDFLCLFEGFDGFQRFFWWFLIVLYGFDGGFSPTKYSTFWGKDHLPSHWAVCLKGLSGRVFTPLVRLTPLHSDWASSSAPQVFSTCGRSCRFFLIRKTMGHKSRESFSLYQTGLNIWKPFDTTAKRLEAFCPQIPYFFLYQTPLRDFLLTHPRSTHVHRKTSAVPFWDELVRAAFVAAQETSEDKRSRGS